MKKYLFLLFSIVPFLLNGTIFLTYEFQSPEMTKVNGYDKISFSGTEQAGKVSEPGLPYFPIKVVLPPNTVISDIQVIREGKVVLNGAYSLYPKQPAIPLSKIGSVPFTEGSREVYNQNAVYPVNPLYSQTTQYYRGYALGFATFTPVEFNPFKKELAYYSRIKIQIETTDRMHANPEFLKNDVATLSYLNKDFANSAELNHYNVSQTRNNDLDYLLITAESKMGIFSQLTYIYGKKGLSTEIVSMESIVANNTGADDQEKLRNYLISRYVQNNVKFVLLAGDTNVIPHRGFYVEMGEYTDNDIPSDLYYNCLDGNWNTDDDSHWGEASEADLAPEFAIGRFCYNNDTEINNFINKVNKYTFSPVVEELKTDLLVGEYLWPNTYGGTYMEEMVGGSSMHGYTTIGVPLSWNFDRLNDTENFEWQSSNLFPKLNLGPNLINHLGHSNTTYCLKIENSQVTTTNITNNGINHNFSNFYSQGCYAGSFDNRTTDLGYTSDCIAEKFTALSTGFVNMVGNSRYGWGSQGSTDGPSQYGHRQFIDAIFGENITTIGYALVDSKIDNIPFITDPVMYWCTYETNLIGDPALDIWTDTPQPITVTYNADFIVGTETINLTANVTDAPVSVEGPDGIIGTGKTSLFGIAEITLSQPILEGQNYIVHISKHNYEVLSDTVASTYSTQPYIFCNNTILTEDGPYVDDLFQSGDSILVALTIKNVGMQANTSPITVSLESESAYFTFSNNNQTIELLNPQSEVTLPQPIVICLNPGVQDNSILTYRVKMQSGTSEFFNTKQLLVHAPAYELISFSLENETSSNYILDPGETANLNITVKNIGSGNAYASLVDFCSDDASITVTNPNGLVNIPSQQTISMTSPLTIQTSTSTEAGTKLLFLTMFDQAGSLFEHTLPISVGQNAFNFENILQGDLFSHTALSGDYGDEWHVSNNRNSTEYGTTSFKCGGEGSIGYSNRLYCALETPQFNLAAGSHLKFKHFLKAEIDTEDTAYDGGFVELDLNNDGFFPILPTNGYPYTLSVNTNTPETGFNYLYSGDINWEQADFDLSAFSGNAKLRFVFLSDGGVTAEGWYIDDIEITNYVGVEDQVQIAHTALFQNSPNPFNPSTTISFQIPSIQSVKLEIYNVRGQRVKSLVNEKLSKGYHSFIWNGKNDMGKSVSSGIYFYRLTTDTHHQVKKMMMLK